MGITKRGEFDGRKVVVVEKAPMGLRKIRAVNVDFTIVTNVVQKVGPFKGLLYPGKDMAVVGVRPRNMHKEEQEYLRVDDPEAILGNPDQGKGV